MKIRRLDLARPTTAARTRNKEARIDLEVALGENIELLVDHRELLVNLRLV